MPDKPNAKNAEILESLDNSNEVIIYKLDYLKSKLIILNKINFNIKLIE